MISVDNPSSPNSYIIGKLGHVFKRPRYVYTYLYRIDDELARPRKCSSYRRTIIQFFLFQWIRKLLILVIKDY